MAIIEAMRASVAGRADTGPTNAGWAMAGGSVAAEGGNTDGEN